MFSKGLYLKTKTYKRKKKKKKKTVKLCHNLSQDPEINVLAGSVVRVGTMSC
jgi:hypothetical protein